MPRRETSEPKGNLEKEPVHLSSPEVIPGAGYSKNLPFKLNEYVPCNQTLKIKTTMKVNRHGGEFIV